MKNQTYGIYSSSDLARRDFRSLVKSLSITFIIVAAILTAVFFLFIQSATAADAIPPNDADLSWGPPVAWDDGSLITTPVTYRVYGSDNSIVANNLTKPRFYVGGFKPGKNCWYVVSITDGVESPPTATKCKNTRAVGSKPNAAANLTVK